MIDRFGKSIKLGDIVSHVDRDKIFLGLVVRDCGSSVKYTLIQSECYFYGEYEIRSSAKVIVMEQTPEFMQSPLRDYRGNSEANTVGGSVKYTWDEYLSRK
jgi:hypothetical protein